MTFQDFDGADLVRACTRKKAYPSEEAARRSVDAIRRANPVAEVRPYNCRRCGQWHVGGVPLAERRYDLAQPDDRSEWDAEVARRRSRGRRLCRGGRGGQYSRRGRRPQREDDADHEERYR